MLNVLLLLVTSNCYVIVLCSLVAVQHTWLFLAL